MPNYKLVLEGLKQRCDSGLPNENVTLTKLEVLAILDALANLKDRVFDPRLLSDRL